MPRRKTTQDDPFTFSQRAVEVLKQSAWTFGAVDSNQVYELRLRLATPSVFTPAKAEIPVPSLPTLDGFLSFLAFRAALADALEANPEFANELLWQWNAALQNSKLWIEFALPLKRVNFGATQIYDCSIGLPIVEGEVSVPAGAFFVQGLDLEPYPRISDSIPLRRRVTQPSHPILNPIRNLDTQSGPTKLLDNRMYYALTEEFVFRFRGDAGGVRRLLDFAIQQRIGIGKKTTLGYGRIHEFHIDLVSGISPTWTRSIPGGDNFSLVKTLPYDAVIARREHAERDFFGCERFRLLNALETLGACYPPYWLKERQTQVLNYGTVLLPGK